MSGVVVNLGPGIVASKLLTEQFYVGWGIGSGVTSVTDTALFSEVALDLTATSGTRTLATGSIVTTTEPNDTVQLVAVLTVQGGGTPSGVTSVTVTNLGLFDNATIGSGTLFAKVDYQQAMFLDDVLTVTFQCPVSN